MIVEGRWGFEESDDDPPDPQPPAHDATTLAGSDCTGSVTVVMSPVGDITAVRLGHDWRAAVGPHGVGPAVAEAAAAAAITAMAHITDQPVASGPRTAAVPSAAAPFAVPAACERTAAAVPNLDPSGALAELRAATRDPHALFRSIGAPS